MIDLRLVEIPKIRGEMSFVASMMERDAPLMANMVHNWSHRLGERMGLLVGLRIIRMEGMRMPTIDRGAITLVDTEKVLLSISAMDLGGVKLPPDQFEWSSSDPGVVLLEDAADLYTRWARTPVPGVSTVRVLHVPSGNDEVLTVTVEFSAPGEIGLSAGTPVLEAEAPEVPPTPEQPV